MTNGAATANNPTIQRREQERIDANREMSLDMQRDLMELLKQYAIPGVWGRGQVTFLIEDGKVEISDCGFIRTRKRQRR